jgi:hypothetical protein
MFIILWLVWYNLIAGCIELTQDLEGEYFNMYQSLPSALDLTPALSDSGTSVVFPEDQLVESDNTVNVTILLTQPGTLMQIEAEVKGIDTVTVWIMASGSSSWIQLHIDNYNDVSE